MRRAVTSLFAPLLVAGLLAGCSGSSGGGAATSGGSGGSGDLPKVSGGYGDKPKVTVAKGEKPSGKLESTVLSQGDGPAVKKGDLLVADYLGEVYGSGKVFDNSYDRNAPAAFPIGVGKVVSGWDKTLVGVKTGSRVLMVLPPKYGYGKAGNSQAGIKGSDTLVFVVDLIASYGAKTTTAAPTAVKGLPPTLPTVGGAWGSEPTITVGKKAVPPKQPKVTVVAKGSGKPLQKGHLLVLQFSAVKWSGEELNKTWGQSGPQAVQVGAPDEQPGTNPFSLLIGTPVGSRVLMTLPAVSGSNPKKESVVVVVDLLGQAGTAKEEAAS